MARIALVMHEPLGAAFKACAQHVLGQKPELTVFDVSPDADPDELSVRLARILLDHAAEPTLILCDIFGATPFNIAKRALKLATERGMVAHLITGTNLCMVLKALTANQDDPERFSETIRQAAVRGIVDAASLV